jgi:hypothetical protein
MRRWSGFGQVSAPFVVVAAAYAARAAYWVHIRMRGEGPQDRPLLVPLHHELELSRASYRELERELEGARNRGDEWFDYGGGKTKTAEVRILRFLPHKKALEMAEPFGGLDA